MMTETLIARAIASEGLQKLDEPVVLSCGAESADFIDAKKVLSNIEALRAACYAITTKVSCAGVTFNCVGGPTMGADPLAIGIGHVANIPWFSYTKGKELVGTPIGETKNVLLLDDVVTTGESILEVKKAVQKAGAKVVAAACLVDRADIARNKLKVPFFALFNYTHFGIPPVILEK